ncbi:hypothetical protein HID58_042660, partial [Brassica napus]
MARQLDDQQPPLPTMITIHTDAAWSENSLFAGFEIIIFDATGGIVERKRSGRFCGLSPYAHDLIRAINGRTQVKKLF